MPSITILTDSAAQFTHSNFPGKDLIQVIPLVASEKSSQDDYRLAAFSDQEIQVLLQQAGQISGHVIAILSSGFLSALPNQILRLIKAASVPPRLVVIDSLSIGIGTGFLVEKAAGMAADDKTCSQIEQTIREDCTTLYSAIVMPDLHSLVPIGLVDAAQANAASVLGIQSMFSLEDGLPSPLGKVRTRRAAYEYLVEFIDEFERFHLIALMQDGNTESNDLQVIHDHLDEFYPGSVLQIFSPNSAWKTIFGDHSYGLVIVSNEENH
jgi:fatty acid-binding protein DegV